MAQGEFVGDIDDAHPTQKIPITRKDNIEKEDTTGEDDREQALGEIDKAAEEEEKIKGACLGVGDEITHGRPEQEQSGEGDPKDAALLDGGGERLAKDALPVGDLDHLDGEEKPRYAEHGERALAALGGIFIGFLAEDTERKEAERKDRQDHKGDIDHHLAGEQEVLGAGGEDERRKQADAAIPEFTGKVIEKADPDSAKKRNG